MRRREFHHVSRRRGGGVAARCFSLLILNDRAAPSYQLLDLSLAGLPLAKLFLVASLLSFEVGVLVLSFLDNVFPLYSRPIQHLTFDYPGYVEGDNVTTLYRWAEGYLDRLPGYPPDVDCNAHYHGF